MSFIVLRLPQSRNGEDGYACCELRGHWVGSTMGLACALPEISTPLALNELSRHAGQSGQWSPGQSLAGVDWRDAGWGAHWLSGKRWERDSLDAFALRSKVAPGHPQSVEPWTCGGFAWCKDHGCWMSTLFTYGGGAESREVARFGWHPAALTVWGWDRDPICDGPHALSATNLLKMGESMAPKGAMVLAEGVKCMSWGGGPAESILKVLQEILCQAEEREISGAAGPGNNEKSQGSSRL